MLQIVTVIASVLIAAEAAPQFNLFGPPPAAQPHTGQPANTGFLGGPAQFGGQQVAGHRLPTVQNNAGNALSGAGLVGTGLFGLKHVLEGNGDLRIRPNVGLAFNHQTGQLAPQIGLSGQIGEGQFAPQFSAGGHFEQGELRPFVGGGVAAQVDQSGNITPGAHTGFSFNKQGQAQGFVGGNVGLTQGLNVGSFPSFGGK